MATRYDDLKAALGADTVDTIARARVLLVGVGGIGCEVLKNLVLTGFRSIEVIDLDTIDVSNLNRQFLFRPQHVTLSKAEVAKDAVHSFNPDATVAAHHANVKGAEYGIDYFRSFDVVMNALDNVSARRHVNRLCLAANVPLVESGTAGYIGQTYVIKKGETRCFDCEPVTDQKTYPICTIRSTPEKPVHCVVWAKELFKLLFGDPKTSMMYEEKEEESVYMREIGRPSEVSDATVAAYARRVFELMFHDEIQQKLELKADMYKTAKCKPVPLVLSDVLAAAGAGNGAGASSGAGALQSQRVLSVAESAALFLAATEGFFAPGKIELLGALEFSKDDELGLDFVTAATNLRAAVFSIPLQSRFDVKSIAGNIIPAIATTNAIVAGLQVLQVLKLLRGCGDVKSRCKYVYCNRQPAGRMKALLLPVALEPPASSCFVCGLQVIEVFADTTVMQLGEFIDLVIKGRLGFNSPDISVGTSVIYEDGESDEYVDVRTRALCGVGGGGIRDGTALFVSDFTQNLSVELRVRHRSTAEFEEAKAPAMFEIVGSGMVAPPPPVAAPQSTASSPTDAVASKKRPRDTAPIEDDTGCVDLADDDDGAPEKRVHTLS